MIKKTVVITGGTRGIGLNITKAFIDEGYNVYVGARKISDLTSFNQASFTFISTDVRREKDIKLLIETAKLETGRLDVVVNNAGYSEWRPIEEIDEKFLSDILATNLMGTMWGCKAAVTNMTNGGSIINISSIAGKRGSTNNSAYVATKFGMNGLTQSIAKEVGPRGIRVNGICPVLVPTDGLIEALKSPHSPANGKGINFIKQFAQNHSALGRLPTGEDVAAMCLFLASTASSAVTAQNINLDCGVFPQ